MKTVLFEVRPANESFAELRDALRTRKADRYARISFDSFDLLWKVLTPNRWRMIDRMTGAGPLGVRELARRLDRDVRAVHADVQELARNGVVERTDDGKYLFPYRAVKVQFELHAAA
ncbi:MAG: DNA-binding protein [Proteobacteria bacterium]|nr:DNA-binding protein [Pseudomonadota bacterium]